MTLWQLYAGLGGSGKNWDLCQQIRRGNRPAHTSALDTFAKLDLAKRQQITLEIALKGQTGLDINDAEAKYTLKSLPGQFSGMHLVSIMYVGMKELDPDTDPGVDLSAEYDAACSRRLNIDPAD